ncbi:MAG: holo-ACP synthase [Promethearchaeota archaeon]
MQKDYLIKLKRELETFFKNKEEFPQFEIGIDIEEISRFRVYSTNQNEQFLQKLFSKRELEYCFSQKDPSPHLTARFCAKEAIYKAINDITPLNLNFNLIEIINDDTGKPRVILHGQEKSKWKIKISLSHSQTHAIAIAVAIPNINNYLNFKKEKN